MKISIVRHLVREGQLELAQTRIGRVSDRVRGEPGLLFRHVGTDREQPMCIVSVTGWQDDASMLAWDVKRRATLPPASGESPYEKVDYTDVVIPDAS
jgi:hypothetical protein